MVRPLVGLLIGVVTVLGSAVPSPEAAAPPIHLIPILSGLSTPILATNARDGSHRLFIVEQGGVIKVLQPGSGAPTVFLDISSKVNFGGEQGLLGLTFHPQYTTNRRFFVQYSRAGDGASVISEFLVSSGDPNVADPLSETIFLTIPQPFGNHNGGMVEFGPDGYLYIAKGDGGSGNDPGNRAQNINDYHGKILRIDVDHPSVGVPYSSPSTNPFFGAVNGLDEIYAYGLRNPWRFSFDSRPGGSGALYVGDVGQGAREEIDIVTLGGNYGWKIWEGSLCSNPPNNDPAQCTMTGFTFPITEYDHTGGRCAVMGGYVYRGGQSSLPLGSYVYGDLCTGEIWVYQSGATDVALDTTLSISSFGEDDVGEIYVVGIGGTVYRIANGNVPAVGVVPTVISAGGTASVSWSGIGSPSPTDWIGLYLQGAGDMAYVDWIYVSCSHAPGAAAATGSCGFVVPPGAAPGNYEFRLFSNNGYTKLATSNALTVSAPAMVGASPSTVPAGASVTASWSGIASPTSTDWIGLYAPGAGDMGYVEWIYVSCSHTAGSAAATGSCAFPIPGGLMPGSYQLRLFSNNGYTKLATSNTFTVTAAAAAGSSPTTVAAGASVTVTWSGIGSPTTTDWIGLFPPGGGDMAYLAWIYVSCSHTPAGPAAAGTCAFAIPGGLAPGSYQLRLYANNGYTRLATGNTFTVTAGGGPTVSVSPTTVATGGSVTASWTGIASPTSTDWMGLFMPGGADTAYLAWIYVSCTQAPGGAAAAGSCAFTIPAGLAPGTYELRLFASNGYTRLATSNPLSVH